jgi:hypothetical protein
MDQPASPLKGRPLRGGQFVVSRNVVDFHDVDVAHCSLPLLIHFRDLNPFVIVCIEDPNGSLRRINLGRRVVSCELISTNGWPH